MENNSLQFGINTDSNHSDNGQTDVEPMTASCTIQIYGTAPRLRKSTYYYCNATKDHRQTAPWQPCRARNITTQTSNEPNKYFVELKDGDGHVSIVPEYFLAFRDLPFIRLYSVFGLRVIAQRDPNLLPHVQQTNNDDYIYLCNIEYGKFYAGIATEQIYLNQLEYFLVFFDDGHVQYVPSSKIRNVIGKFTWDGINENLTKFIRYYNKLRRIAVDSSVLNLNFERLKEEQIIKVELDGRWQKAKVMINFHKMIKIQFDVSNRFEWLYCESPRFENTWRMINSNRMLNECLSSVITTNGDNVIHLDDDDDDVDCGKANWNHLSRDEILDRMDLQLKVPNQRFVQHKCNGSCLSNQEKSNKMYRANQLSKPLMAGWQVIRINNDVEQKVIYITPCGRYSRNMNEVHKFLMTTGSQLGVDCFTFDSSIDCTRIYKDSHESNILTKDISMGLEHLPIPLVVHLDSGSPDPFKYTLKMNITHGVPYFMCNPYRKVCCDCVDDCSDKEKCACWKMNNQYAQIGKKTIVTGYEYKRLQNRINGGIYECHDGCKCKKMCFNRVAQQSLNHFLEIFKTKKCGWGVRCINDIPKGTFVTCYFGDILADRNADARAEKNGDTYFYNLNVTHEIYGRPKIKRAKIEIVNYFPINIPENIDLNDNLFLVDAKHCGNVARFLNHSCDPNMFEQDVYIDTHDERFPRLAFFTNRNVQAGEELTIDYGYEPNSIEGRSMICECKAKNCRKRLL